jgi:hypothetical protein
MSGCVGAGRELSNAHAKFRTVFCKVVSDEDADVPFAAQKASQFHPLRRKCSETGVEDRLDVVLGICSKDQVINPALERCFAKRKAKRMHAKSSQAQSSHVSRVSHPSEIVKLIEEAARSTMSGRWGLVQCKRHARWMIPRLRATATASVLSDAFSLLSTWRT